jgi:hypothetical protein
MLPQRLLIRKWVTSPIDVKATVDTLAAFRGMTSGDLTQAINSNLRTLLKAAGVSNEN